MQITEQDTFAKVEELKNNEIFMARLAKADTPADMVSLFADYDMELTPDGAVAAIKAANAESEELSEDDLESVSGGGFGSLLLTFGCVVVIAFILLVIALRGCSRQTTQKRKP